MPPHAKSRPAKKESTFLGKSGPQRSVAYATVNVLRSHWGRGIGQRLAAAVDTWAREQNLRRLTGHVLAHNTRALRFANVGGFREELVSPRYAVMDGCAVDRVRVVTFFLCR